LENKKKKEIQYGFNFQPAKPKEELKMPHPTNYKQQLQNVIDSKINNHNHIPIFSI